MLDAQNNQDPLIGRTLGPYQLIKRIGHGGMGMVYEAIHTQLQISYAIKILHPTLTADQLMVARLRREATLALQLQHENIVRVLDYGCDDELGFYLVMELLRGFDLGTLLKSKPILPIVQVASIIYPICDALRLAHQRGIVHRDLKPGNFFLIPTQEGGFQIKLLDFGIARLVNPEEGQQTQLTRAGKSFGTPEYMPPEQIRAQREKIGPATDIYGLSVVIFRMLTGRLPFVSKNLIDLMNQVMLQTPPMLSRFRPEFGGTQLERLLYVCMAKNPANRVQPMEVFFEQFRDALEQDPRLLPILEQEMRTGTPAQVEQPHADALSDEETAIQPDDSVLHDFLPGQTFVFGGETFSFDGERFRTSNVDAAQSWGETDEVGKTTPFLAERDEFSDAERLLAELLSNDEFSLKRQLPPPPNMNDEYEGDDDTIMAPAVGVHEQTQADGAALFAPLAEVLEQLPTVAEPGGLTLPPEAVHKKLEPSPMTFEHRAFDALLGDPTRVSSRNPGLPAPNKPSGPSLRARLLRVLLGFCVGFLLIGAGVWGVKAFFPDLLGTQKPCCSLYITSTPSGAKVIEQGKTLGVTPLLLKRKRGQALQFVIMKPPYGLETGSWRALRNRNMHFSLSIHAKTR